MYTHNMHTPSKKKRKWKCDYKFALFHGHQLILKPNASMFKARYSLFPHAEQHRKEAQLCIAL